MEITKAEIYAVEVIERELRKTGLKPSDIAWKTAAKKAIRLLVNHQDEVRGMYAASENMLSDWILENSGIRALNAFDKMERLGLTGDVMHDLKILKAGNGKA